MPQFFIDKHRSITYFGSTIGTGIYTQGSLGGGIFSITGQENGGRLSDIQAQAITLAALGRTRGRASRYTGIAEDTLKSRRATAFRALSVGKIGAAIAECFRGNEFSVEKSLTIRDKRPIIDSIGIIACYASGHANEETGELLHMSEDAVKSRKSALVARLRVANMDELLTYCYLGGIELDEAIDSTPPPQA